MHESGGVAAMPPLIMRSNGISLTPEYMSHIEEEKQIDDELLLN
jgi:hypothetical protein